MGHSVSGRLPWGIGGWGGDGGGRPGFMLNLKFRQFRSSQPSVGFVRSHCGRRYHGILSKKAKPWSSLLKRDS